MSFLMFCGCGVGLGQGYRGADRLDEVDNMSGGTLWAENGFWVKTKTKGLCWMLHFIPFVPLISTKIAVQSCRAAHELEKGL
jgi:hypothetical protein